MWFNFPLLGAYCLVLFLKKKKEILKFFSFFVLFSPFNERIVVDFNKIEFVNLSFGRKFFYINNF